MSNAMQNRVRNIKTGGPITNHVMRYLADCHNPKLGAWPSQKRIADALELSIQSVRRAINSLEEKGIICRRYEMIGGKIRRTYYDFIGAPQVATTESVPTREEGDRCPTDTTYINILKRKGNGKEVEGPADHFEDIESLLGTVLTPNQRNLFAAAIDPRLTDLFLTYARERTARPNPKWQARKPASKFEYLLHDFPRDRKREITETLNEQNTTLPTLAEREAADRQARSIPLRTPGESVPILQGSGRDHSESSNGGRPLAEKV